MFTNLVDQFKAKVLGPAIDARMREVGQAMVAEATRLVPVDTGFLKSTIGYSYNVATKTVTLYADAKYSLFVEFGTRHQAAHSFLRPAMAVVPRIWKGGLGSAISGHSVAISAPNVAPKYHAQILSHSAGKMRGARLHVGHGRFR
jgi:HK97 gp10 family phage protein